MAVSIYQENFIFFPPPQIMTPALVNPVSMEVHAELVGTRLYATAGLDIKAFIAKMVSHEVIKHTLISIIMTSEWVWSIPSSMHLIPETPNPCNSNPCLNRGTCYQYGSTDFRCMCPPDFYGHNCCFCESHLQKKFALSIYIFLK